MLHLNGLNNAVDRVHSYLDEWGDQHVHNGGSDTQNSVLHEARLAVHEWMANLVQHANFQERRPLIDLNVKRKGRAIQCVITDNSDGFDLDRALETALEENRFEALPERGMGLLMLYTCTSDLSYEATEEGQHRLVFRVRPNSKANSEFAAVDQLGNVA